MWRADVDLSGLVAPIAMLGHFATLGIIRVGDAAARWGERGEQGIDAVSGCFGCGAQPAHDALVRRSAGGDGVKPDGPAQQVLEPVAVEPLDAFPRVHAHRGADGIAGQPRLDEAQVRGPASATDRRGRRQCKEDADLVGDPPRRSLVEACRPEPGSDYRRHPQLVVPRQASSRRHRRRRQIFAGP